MVNVDSRGYDVVIGTRHMGHMYISGDIEEVLRRRMRLIEEKGVAWAGVVLNCLPLS